MKYLILMSCLLGGCEQPTSQTQEKNASLVSADSDLVQMDPREYLAAMRLSHLRAMQFHAERAERLRGELASEEVVGKAEVLKMDLLKAMEKEELASENHSEVYREWIELTIGHPITGPEHPAKKGEIDYDTILGKFRDAFYKALREDEDLAEEMWLWELDKVVEKFSE